MENSLSAQNKNLVPQQGYVDAEYVVIWTDESGQKHTSKIRYLKSPEKHINKVPDKDPYN